MPRLSFLFRTDTHVSDRSPESWKGDYPTEIWSNLTQIGDLARQHQVTGVLDGGDYFHVKSASKNPHALVEKTARLHKDYPCPTFCIEGNHDLSANNLETIHRQPLGVLYATGVFQHLREEVFTDGDLQVRVVGVPYSPTRTLEDLLRIQKKPGDTHLIMVVHALAARNPPPTAEDFFNEPVFPYQALVRRNGPDVVCFGHWHRDQGVDEIDGRFFVNQGAVSRGSLVRENLERTPKVSLIEFDGGAYSNPVVTQIPLVVAPACDVFDLERKANQERERKDIDQFVLRLLADTNFDPAIEVEENIRRLDFAQNVRDLALHYYELGGSVG